MTEYVAGFLFDSRLNDVALILKNRGPAGMAGKLNAIGGHLEDGESPLQAMIREFKEETDADVTDWKQFATLGGEDWTVHFFKAVTSGYPGSFKLKTITDEKVGWFSINHILSGYHEYKPMKNLKWLIPMALDNDVDMALVLDKVPQ